MLVPAAMWLGCGGGADVVVGPELGTLEITTTTSGPEPDPDGYAASVDGAAPEGIGTNATSRRAGLPVGNHTVVLSGLAPNCTVAGGTSLTVRITANTVVPAAFVVQCAPTMGSIQVTIASTGAPADPDGYELLLDGADAQAVSVSDTVTLPGLAPGPHTLGLGGVAQNCEVQGNDPQGLTVTAGQTATAAISVTCAAPPPATGTLEVTTTTSGTNQDADGYGIGVDDGTAQPIGLNATLSIASLVAGSHRVRLTGVAANCSVGNNPRNVSVPEGGEVAVAFTVSCSATTGSLTLTIVGLPSGTGADVTVTGPAGYTQQITETRTLAGLAPGDYLATAADVANGTINYTPSPKTRTATVAAGDTAGVTVTYAAVAPTLNLRIAGWQLTQSTQTADDDIPLVKGRDAFLRVFAVANQANSAAPKVRVRVYHDRVLMSTLTIAAPGSSTPTSRDESTLEKSWNVTLPGSLIQNGLGILVDVDPDNAIPEKNESDNTSSESGTPQAETVATAPTFKLALVPVKQVANGLQGDVSESNKPRFLDLTRRMHPLSEIDAHVHALFTTDSGTPALEPKNTNDAWGTVLSQLDALRIIEGTEATYYGVVRIDYTTGIAGIGFIGVPTAIGYDDRQDGPRVMAHELGHTWGRFHSPCGQPAGIDPDYPYAGGKIGVFGVDVANAILKDPSLPDIMGYCSNPWISDYNYRAIEAFRAAQLAQAARTPAAGVQPCLLVWGRIVNGQPMLEPAFEVVTRPSMPKGSGPYSVEGTAADGARMFGFSFEAAAVPDDPRGGRNFAFAVPLDHLRAARLESLHLAGPGGGAVATSRAVAAFGAPADADSVVARRVAGGVALHWEAAAHPMIVVRDARTGEVLSFARGGQTELATGTGELDLLLSDGVRSRGVRVAVGR
ncbi:MAG TPA: CARDB domain-containing protein [Gemmatimonadales bacterium]|nr:CARDB domain-containing protein [Gemmatimonadales bacterium]